MTGKLAPTCRFLLLSFPHAAQASWRSGWLPTMVISILLFFLPGDQLCPYRAPPEHSLAISSTARSLGRSESLEKSQPLRRRVGCCEGLGAGGCLLGLGVPLLFSLALCSWPNKSQVLFWPGAHVRDGRSLAGLWLSLAVEVPLTALCPEKATVFGAVEDLFLPTPCPTTTPLCTMNNAGTRSGHPRSQ